MNGVKDRWMRKWKVWLDTLVNQEIMERFSEWVCGS